LSEEGPRDKNDKGEPIGLAEDMLRFWKQHKFVGFDPKKAFFSPTTRTSTYVSLYIPVKKHFTLPSEDQLDRFITYVDEAGPDTYQEGDSGMLYGCFLDIEGVRLEKKKKSSRKKNTVKKKYVG
jgi:hypothetical protein